MKSFIFTVTLLALFLSINAQEDTMKNSKLCKEEKQAEQVKKVQALIESKSFVFSVRQAIPLCGDPVSLEFLYSLKLDNGIVSSYLPFYGFDSDYQIENSPLIFRDPYESYSVDKNKDKYEINFNVLSEDNDMKFYMRISELGYAYLKITSDQRQSISFLGIIDDIEPAVFSSKCNNT